MPDEPVIFQLNDHLPHDNYMPNALPLRKMFSATPADNGEPVSKDNRTGGMGTVRALAKAIKADGKLRYPKV